MCTGRGRKKDTEVDIANNEEGVDTSSGTGKHKNHKCKSKAVLAVESSGKKPKANGKGKEKAAEGDSASPYCKIHLTSDHDIQECRQVEYLARKQKEYERRYREKKAKGEAGGFNKKDEKSKK